MARAEKVGDERSLPKGWRWVRFDEMAESITERVDDPSQAGVDFYVGLEHLDPDSLRIRRWGTPDDVAATKLRFGPGDIIFGRRRAYQRKIAVAEFEGICSAHALVLRAREEIMDKKFLPFFMQSEAFFNRALSISVGSLSPTINWKTLARQEFALPPKPEQQRIADILWSTHEHAMRFEFVELSLRRLRDSIIDEMSHLQEGWEETTIDSLVEEGIIDPPQDGNHGELHPKAKDYVESGVPFVMANNIRDGEVQLDGCKRIPRGLADSLRVGFSTEGDVLLTHKGTVGEVAIVPQLHDDYIMLTPQVTYYRVADKTKLNRRFLFISFMSRDFQRQLSIASAQSTRSYVGITAQRKLHLPLPPLEEQERVVNHLDNIERRVEDVRRVQATVRKIRPLVLDSFLKPAL